MTKVKQNQLTYMHFTVFGADGVTPLTGQAGACTSILELNAGLAPEGVSIAERAASGKYRATFTPLSVGEYDLEVTCPDGRVVGEPYEVEANNLDDLGTHLTDVKGTGFVKDTHSLTDILEDTGTTIPAQITALNNLSSSDVQTVLENNDLDHLLKIAHPSGDPVIDTIMDLIMNKDGSQTFDPTTDSQEAIRDKLDTVDVNTDEIEGLIKQNRKHNISTELYAATIDDNVRNVLTGMLDHIIYKVKDEGDSDWSSPVTSGTLYAWYETKGDSNPIILKEDG